MVTAPAPPGAARHIPGPSITEGTDRRAGRTGNGTVRPLTEPDWPKPGRAILARSRPAAAGSRAAGRRPDPGHGRDSAGDGRPYHTHVQWPGRGGAGRPATSAGRGRRRTRQRGIWPAPRVARDDPPVVPCRSGMPPARPSPAIGPSRRLSLRWRPRRSAHRPARSTVGHALAWMDDPDPGRCGGTVYRPRCRDGSNDVLGFDQRA